MKIVKIQKQRLIINSLRRMKIKTGFYRTVMMKNLYILIVVWCIPFIAMPQETEENTRLADSVINLFSSQLSVYPQEKIYLQIDKPEYISGETLWFRAYLLDALLHVQANASRYLYVELVDPLGEVANRVKIRPDSLGTFYGQLVLDEGLDEGDYMLRAYTLYMKNQGEDYFFKKSIRVINPLSVNFDIDTRFSFDNRRTTAQVSFTDKIKKERFIPEKCVVLINDNEYSLSFDENALGTVSFRIPDEEKQRVMTFRFQYLNEIFTKHVAVPHKEEDFDVAFMPEGGYLPVGINSFVAFKAIRANGLSESISGKIVDEEGNVVVPEFTTEHSGMGKFTFQAKEGKAYFAECTNEDNVTKRFSLPFPRAAYAGIQVNQVKNRIYVAVKKTADYDDSRPLYLLAHLRGAVLYCNPVDSSQEYVVFEDSFFPSGIVQFLLFDENRDILSERLLFNYNENDIARVHFSTDKEEYDAREHIVASVKIKDIAGEALGGNFSVSVTDDNDILPDSSVNIVSYLLLSSELKGYIENPNYYLQQDNRKVKVALDLLMLTHGWRRYDVESIVKGNIEEPVHSPETGQVISGKASTIFSSLKDGYISILALNDSINTGEVPDSIADPKTRVVPHVVQTDQSGYFELRDIEFPDETRFIVQANTKSNRGSWVHLEMDKTDPYPPVEWLMPLESRSVPWLSNEAITKADAKYVMEEGMRVINLSEVVVTARRRTVASESPYYSPLSSSQVFTSEMIEKRSFMDMRTLLLQIPGLTFTGDQMSVRGGGAPLVILDNIPYESEFFSVLDLDVMDVEELFLIKNATAGTMFGSRAANGALVINTKKGDFEAKNKLSGNISEFIKPLGYQNPVEFYSPKYDTSELENQPDLRTTIFWEPNVAVDKNGEASFDFYSADAETTYSVVIEGISEYGHLIYQVAKIKRNSRVH